MPIIKSAVKALRQDKKRAKNNMPVKKKFREAVKKARKKPTLKNLKQAYSILDKAAKKKIIHKNKAARLKSRLAKLLKKKKANKK